RRLGLRDLQGREPALLTWGEQAPPHEPPSSSPGAFGAGALALNGRHPAAAERGWRRPWASRASGKARRPPGPVAAREPSPLASCYHGNTTRGTAHGTGA